MQDELEDLRDCGLLGCRPQFIQKLANIKVRFKSTIPHKKTQNISARSPRVKFTKRCAGI
jgi:hypothetical protein